MRTKFSPKWVSLFKGFGVLCLAVIGALGIWTKLILCDRPASVTQVNGTVLYSPSGSSQWITARPGQELQRGDQLLTDSQDSGVVVIFSDQNIAFRLEADSLITMTARWNRLTGSGSGGLFLSQGILKAETQPGSPEKYARFRIDTPLAQANVQGTRLIVQVLRSEQTTRISSLEGEVRVRARPDHAMLYQADTHPLPARESVITDNETLIVYAEPPSLEALVAHHQQGRVIDRQTGLGIEGVIIQVVGDPAIFAETDTDGYFNIPGSTTNSELMMVGTTGEASGELELITQVGQAKGRVVDFFEFQGVADVKVTPLRFPSLATSTDSDGAFTIQELPVGSHTLIVSTDGYISAVAEVTILQGTQISIGNVQLVPLNGVFHYLPIIMKNYQQYP
jgi:hypothetical protein